MPDQVAISGNTVHLADPDPIPECEFIGRDSELSLCRAAWGVTAKSPFRFDPDMSPLNFRLHGPPGVGKNEVVYQLARDLGLDLYVIPGHEELTPEDLALVLVPDASATDGNAVAPLILRASPLATAIYRGGLVFFDEINRVPERALSPLASVLDNRRSIFSAMTGINILPRDDAAARRFRFCCALNPALENRGVGLPEYIAQRTLPVINVEHMELSDLRKVLRANLPCSKAFETAFEKWYDSPKRKRKVSVREALSLVNFAIRLKQLRKCSEHHAIAEASENVIL